MKVLSWNCRGLRKITTIQRCKRLLSHHAPDFVFLSETKIPFVAAYNILNKFGFKFSIGTDACNLGGGTIIAWSKDFIVDVLVLTNHVCHCKISSNEDAFLCCYFSFIYGPPNPPPTTFFGTG